MRSRYLFTLIILLLTFTCCSQSVEKKMVDKEITEPLEEMQVPEELVKDKVVIFNSSGETLTFQLGESIADMNKIKIKPYKNEISVSFKQRPTFIIYTTNEIFSKYTLELGESYKIYFNTEQKKWDLIHLVQSEH